MTQNFLSQNMKRLSFIIFFLLCTQFSSAQSVSKSDSLQVMVAMEKVFRNFESPGFSEFQKIATEEIWCLVCDGALNSEYGPYKIRSKEFYDTYLKNISDSGYWKRAAKSSEIRLQKVKNSSDSITAFITIWNKNEYAPGHEGAELGIHFRKIDRSFKFSGIETIP